MITMREKFSDMSNRERLALIEKRRIGRTTRLVSHKDFKNMCKLLNEGTEALRIQATEVLEEAE